MHIIICQLPKQWKESEKPPKPSEKEKKKKKQANRSCHLFGVCTHGWGICVCSSSNRRMLGRQSSPRRRPSLPTRSRRVMMMPTKTPVTTMTSRRKRSLRPWRLRTSRSTARRIAKSGCGSSGGRRARSASQPSCMLQLPRRSMLVQYRARMFVHVCIHARSSWLAGRKVATVQRFRRVRRRHQRSGTSLHRARGRQAAEHGEVGISL